MNNVGILNKVSFKIRPANYSKRFSQTKLTGVMHLKVFKGKNWKTRQTTELFNVLKYNAITTHHYSYPNKKII